MKIAWFKDPDGNILHIVGKVREPPSASPRRAARRGRSGRRSRSAETVLQRPVDQVGRQHLLERQRQRPRRHRRERGPQRREAGLARRQPRDQPAAPSADNRSGSRPSRSRCAITCAAKAAIGAPAVGQHIFRAAADGRGLDCAAASRSRAAASRLARQHAARQAERASISAKRAPSRAPTSAISGTSQRPAVRRLRSASAITGALLTSTKSICDIKIELKAIRGGRRDGDRL